MGDTMILSSVKLTVFIFVIQAGASQGSQSEDLTPYGALSLAVQRRLDTGSLNGYGALVPTDREEGVLVVPSSPNLNLDLAPYGALSDRVQLRLSQGYAAPPASPNRLNDDTVLVEASNPKTNPRFSPGIQSQPTLTPYGALAGARPVKF